MNKRRNAKTFPLAAIMIFTALAACVAVFAIKALTVKYQVIQGGEKMKRLERELAELTVKNEALQTQKDILTSPPALQKALAKGVLKLLRIDEKFVVRVVRPTKNIAATLVAPGEGGR